MFRFSICLLGSMLFLALAAPAAMCDDEEGSITSSSRSHDPRLEHKVAIGAGRIALGALLEDLSAQSGVTLRIDERDVLSGIPILAMLKDVPLAEAMNALLSLLSYSGAPWKWELEGKNDHCVYSLAPTLAAHNLATRLRREARLLFDAHAAAMMRIAQLTPDERKKHIKELSGSLLQSNDRMAQDWVDYEGIWEGLRTIAESVPPEVQDALFHGETNVNLPVDKLSPTGIQFLDHYLARVNPSGINPDGSHALRSTAKEITISAVYRGNIMPAVTIHVSGRGFSFIGGPGLDMGHSDRIGKQWILPGYKENSPSEKVVSSLGGGRDRIPMEPRKAQTLQ